MVIKALALYLMLNLFRFFFTKLGQITFHPSMWLQSLVKLIRLVGFGGDTQSSEKSRFPFAKSLDNLPSHESRTPCDVTASFMPNRRRLEDWRHKNDRSAIATSKSGNHKRRRDRSRTGMFTRPRNNMHLLSQSSHCLTLASQHLSLSQRTGRRTMRLEARINAGRNLKYFHVRFKRAQEKQRPCRTMLYLKATKYKQWNHTLSILLLYWCHGRSFLLKHGLFYFFRKLWLYKTTCLTFKLFNRFCPALYLNATPA